MKLRATSIFVGVSHVIALAYAGIFLKDGTPGNGSVRARASYIVEHEAAWIGGWMVFVIAGAALLWWVILLRDRLDPDRKKPALHFAVLLTAIGLALECVAHGLSSGLLPPLAENGDFETFEAAERTIQMFALVLGQASFGAGMLFVVLELTGVRTIGALTIGAGFINVAASAGAVVATLANKVKIAPVATGVVILTLFALSLGVGFSGWARDD